MRAFASTTLFAATAPLKCIKLLAICALKRIRQPHRNLGGEINHAEVDAIVNAANSSLLGGGGVDGAIDRAAGPELLAECRTLGGCPTGQARITCGHRLPARHVIHCVGPVWHGGKGGEDELLAQCYRHALELAVQHTLKTIAFPAISTGIYGFPLERAAAIAVREVRQFLHDNPGIERVIFVCFDPRTLAAYQALLQTTHR